MNHGQRKRTTGIAALCALLAPTISISGSTAEATEPANVVMILLDDARLDDLATMPNVASLIGNMGATFAQAYTPFPLCSPDRATLLSGQYAHNHGVLRNDESVGGFTAFDDSQTIATWLDEAYETGFVGKYLNGYGANGTSRYVPPGWDEWHAAGKSEVYVTPRINDNGVVTAYTGQYFPDVVANSAVNFLESSAANPDPFFLLASFSPPHNGTPVEAGDPTGYATPNVGTRHANAFDDRPLVMGPAFNEQVIADKPVKPNLLTQSQIRGITELDQQRRESLLYVEDAVARIVQTLQASGELENTYIIFTSDNGFLLGEHRLTGKGNPYQESVQVPLLIRGPGIPAGTVVQQHAGAQDIAPTVLAMTGQTGAEGTFPIDGLNLLPLIPDPTLHADRPIVLEGPMNAAGVYQYHGIRTPEWKYVERATGRVELYDMIRDPYELSNRAGVARYAATQASLDALLEQYKFCVGAQCV